MLNDLEWNSLQSRRQQDRLSMLYRIRYNLVDMDWTQFLTTLSTSTRGHKSRFWTPFCSSKTYHSSFFPRTIRDWNLLEKDPADFRTLDAFKAALRSGSK